MNYQIAILLLVATINAILSLVLILGRRTLMNTVYSVFAIFISLWSVGLAFFLQESDLDRALSIANFYYVAAAGIATLFLFFSLIFPNKPPPHRATGAAIFVPLILLIGVFYFYPDFLIHEIRNTTEGKGVTLNIYSYLSYAALFVLYILSAYYNLFAAYSLKKSREERLQLAYVIYGTIIPFILGMIFNLFLPFLGNYEYIWVGPIFTLLMVTAIGYAVRKHHLFEGKVIATELLTFAFWLAITMRILLSDSLEEHLVNGLLLIASVILGILLIRSVIREVETREKVERLAKNLERTNKDLEKANDRLKELDQLKSEFVSLATHQIRGPLAAIKGYASLIMEGDFGAISAPLKDPIDKIFQSSQSLVVIVEDFLNISRIELGRMKYDFTDFDLSALVSETVAELGPNIEKRGLTLTTSLERNVTVRGDIGKVKQIISNLIDNAVKYTPKGSVEVSLSHSGTRAHFSVKDTGIGIPADVMPHLFQKFSRAKDASKTNIMGTGLGLYVASEMVKAHNGKIWAESAGTGKGSTFRMELECCKAEFMTPTSAAKSVNMLS